MVPRFRRVPRTWRLYPLAMTVRTSEPEGPAPGIPAPSEGAMYTVRTSEPEGPAPGIPAPSEGAM
jgi:hypothetical protein